MSNAEVDQFRRRNRQFASAATAVITFIGAVGLAIIVVVALRGHTMRAERLERLALSWAPTVCYLWALWALRAMFMTLARDGLSFGPAVVRALERVGWALGLGALLTLAEAPMSLWLTHGVSPGGFATLNVPALTLGVI